MISGDRGTVLGKSTAFAMMLKEFSKYWERIDVITPKIRGKPETKNQKLKTPLNVHFHPSPYGLWYQPVHIWRKGGELVREHKHDRATVHEYPPFYNGLGAALLHKKTDISYTLEVHHVVGHPRAATVLERVGYHLTRIFLRWDCKYARSVRCVNASVASLLLEFGVPGEKVSVVPSFYLDHEILRPDPSIRKQYDLVACCRLVPNKGLDELLKAIAILKGEGKTVTLLIIGDGPLRGILDRRAKVLQIHEQVTFTGWLGSSVEVVSKVKQARAFVLSSKSEGGPRSALEAMACGIPVIATPVGVMSEVIESGENGFLTTGTPQDLAQKIRSLLSQEHLQTVMGERARKTVARFDKIPLISAYAAFLKREKEATGGVS
jgi:glycosyltransferase involved in cell wall biosynthesis